MTGLLNDAGRLWAEYFGLGVIQNTIFLALVFAALRMLRNMPARVKHMICLTGLIKLILPPFVPSGIFSRAVEIAEPVSGAFSAIVFTGAGSVEYTARPGAEAISIFGMMFAAWMLAAAAYIIYTFISSAALGRRLDRAVFLKEVVISPGRAIGVYRSEEINMPVTLGLFTDRIFVPAIWDEWDSRCRDLVLRHEIAHIRRRDGLAQVLSIAVKGLYFFHPLALILCRKSREYMEMACDDASIGIDRDANVEYSRYLVEIAERIISGHVAPESASALIRRKNELLNRVRYQMRGGHNPMSKTKTVAVIAMMILWILPLSWYYSKAALPASSGPEPAAGDHIEKTIRIPKDTVTEEELWKLLLDELGELSEKDKDKIVLKLVIDDEVTMKTVHALHAALQEKGYLKVKYEGEGGESLPLILPGKDMDEVISIHRDDMSYILVKANGDIYLDYAKIDTDKLTRQLRKLLEENNKLIIAFNSEPEATYYNFRDVLRKIKEADIKRILIRIPREGD